MDELTNTQIALGVAGIAIFVGYALFILVPAWTSYGRVWERLAASFLTLYILATLLGIGAAIGVTVFLSSD